MEEIKRTFGLKLETSPDNIKFLQDFMPRYAEAVRYTLKHIENIHKEHERIVQPQKGKCFECTECVLCKENNHALDYKNKITQALICSRCFSRKWDYMTLTKAEGFQKQLIESFPTLSVHKGYYAGVIKMSCPIYKSYMSKREEREYEINQLVLQVQSATDPIRKYKLQGKLNHKNKAIKDLEFRGNVVYLGNAGMFELKKENGEFFIGFTSPYEKRTKVQFKFILGDKYGRNHNVISMLEKEIESKEYKKLFGKILKREEYYEFMYPKRDISESLETEKEVGELYLKNKEMTIVGLSFGIKRPLTAVIMKENKIMSVKTFGSGELFNYVEREANHRSKVTRDLSKRYAGKWKRRKHLRKVNKKKSKKEKNYIQYYSHVLSRRFIDYITINYPKSIVVFTDTSKIKNIHYSREYQRVLSKWNIQFQKTLIEYKGKLANHYIYFIPKKLCYQKSCQICKNYEEKRVKINDVTCSKCGVKFIKDKKILKSLTVKLLHATETEDYFRHRTKVLQDRINKLLSYENKKEKHFEYIKKISVQLEEAKRKVHALNQQDQYKILKCPACNHQEDFYKNEAINLCSLLHESIEARGEHASS